jgi:hypothetical protein
MERIEILGIGSKDLSADRFRLAQTTGPLVLDGGLENLAKSVSGFWHGLSLHRQRFRRQRHLHQLIVPIILWNDRSAGGRYCLLLEANLKCPEFESTRIESIK